MSGSLRSKQSQADRLLEQRLGEHAVDRAVQDLPAWSGKEGSS